MSKWVELAGTRANSNVAKRLLLRKKDILLVAYYSEETTLVETRSGTRYISLSFDEAKNIIAPELSPQDKPLIKLEDEGF